jgi:hypothetical protein
VGGTVTALAHAIAEADEQAIIAELTFRDADRGTRRHSAPAGE